MTGRSLQQRLTNRFSLGAHRLQSLRPNDGVAWGVHLSFLCPEVIEFCGVLGFRWLFLDAEHTPLDRRLCRELVRAADVVGMPCMVRVPQIEASVIEGFLESGVVGIMAPNVASATQVQALMAAVKFTPEGACHASAMSRAASYGLPQPPEEFARLVNQATFTAALIESQAGIDQLDAIVAVPGLDYVSVGPNDLGLSLRLTGGMANPQVRAIVAGARARIKASGKPQIAVVGDAAQAREAVTTGATLVAVCDTALLAGAGRSFLDDVSNC
jgi:4-hydroxy-2-oxoheptanedioate aldolase